MLSAVTPYLFFMRLSFLRMLAFRLRYYTGVVSYLIYVSIYWYLWQAIYENSQEIGGFNIEEITTYVAVGWISRSFYFNNTDYRINERVVSGKVAFDLLRPVDFQIMHLARAFGESLFRILLFSLPAGLAICAVFPVRAPAGMSALAGFLFMTFVAFIINLQISFLVGLISFRTHNIWGIMRVKYVALQLLSGLVVPLSFYPKAVQDILSFTPFPFMASVPLSIYLGKYNASQTAGAVLISFLWIFILFAVGRGCWNMCRRRLIIQGG